MPICQQCYCRIPEGEEIETRDGPHVTVACRECESDLWDDTLMDGLDDEW